MIAQFGFRHLLGGILATYVVAIALPGHTLNAALRVGMLGGVLLLAIRSKRRAGSLNTPALILAITLLLATVLVAVFGTAKELAIMSECATIVLVVAAMVVLINTLLGLGAVNQTTVNGVLCIYLLLALLFGSINELFATIVTHYVNGASNPVSSSEMLYYSVITLTTVGFGDIAPASNLARSVAATEALIGQLYLVSVVAAVVARYPGRNRS